MRLENPRAPRALIGGLALCVAVCFGACDKPPEETAPPISVARVDPVEPPSEGHPTGAVRARTVYVPAYSHLTRDPNAERRVLLSILLSVRNVDSVATITLTHVDYFDTSGRRVRRYLAQPRTLRPLETAEFEVATRDVVGGSGANFLVYWEGPSDAHPLLTETVMLGNLGAGFVTFTSRGVELDRRPDPRQFKGADAGQP